MGKDQFEIDLSKTDFFKSVPLLLSCYEISHLKTDPVTQRHKGLFNSLKSCKDFIFILSKL